MINWGKLISICILFLLHSVVDAEIYKYRDANGNWQFTDKPPADSTSKSVQTIKSKTAKNNKSFDFSKTLRDKYKPQSNIESGTLAVVKIQSKMGSGSGFFVTDQCHIVTNKHVVRPTDSKSWLERNEELKKEKAAIDDAKLYIEEEKDRLAIRKQNLREYEQYINGMKKGDERDKEQRAYDLHMKKYKRMARELDKRIVETEQREKSYKSQNSEFSMNSSIATLAKSFKIILKDDTNVNAGLIKVAKDVDLALLKIENCKSPFLKFDRNVRIHQGLNVFAIGSPLGLKDHVTTGIVTNYDNDGINIDAKVLPGNSGGPLLTKNGDVIGVNTFKIAAENAYNEGFGIAIPVELIVKNFGSVINLR